VPANSKQVVLSLGNMLALYNDTGLVNVVPGSYVYTFTPIFNSITFAGASQKIYSLPFTTVQNSYFGSVTMDATGLQYPPVTGTNYGGDNTTGGQVVSDGTLLYTSAGQVWDPSTASKVGTFPVTTYNSTSYPNERNLTFDGGLGELYVIGYQAYGSSSSANVLTAYSPHSLAITGTLAFPDIQSVILSNLVRWGADGFAFVGSGNVYVVRSNVVSPSGVNPSPGLISISPFSANAGDAAFTLTLNGTNFTPASVASWNQMPLPTTYVSGTQLTVTVPASNIATAGTAQITVSNPGPGGGISSAQPFSIPGSPTITFNIDNHTFGDAPFEVSARSNSSGAISYSVLSGPATISGSTLTITGAGTISVKADQMAAGSYSASSQNTSFTVGKAAGTMAIASSANPVLLQNPVTITASIASTATGTVVFTEGSSKLATVGVTNGVAAFTTSTLPTGSHTILATYSGDANFSGSTKTVTQVVQEFALAVAPNGGSSQTVQRGSSAVYKLLLNPSGTPLPGAVTLAVSGLPAGATAAFSPSTVAAGAGATPIILTVQVPVNLAGLDKHLWGDAASLSLALILIPVARRRSPLGRLVMVVCLGLVSSTLVACGGSSSSSSSQSSSKTYILTVTAGPNIQSTTLTMIVQ
jgi:hypothetical protein